MGSQNEIVIPREACKRLGLRSVDQLDFRVEAGRKLLRRARTTLDRAEAKPLWDEFQQILHDEQPYIFLIYNQERWGASRRLHGAEPVGAPNAYAPLASVARWWIPPDRR